LTTGTHGDGREPLGRTLYDITQLLESADGADRRVWRVLELLRGLVPYEQCAMLEARLGYEPRVVVVPDTPADERAVLTGMLLDIFGQLVDARALSLGPVAGPKGGMHLAVPLVGLDEVIGLLLVRSSSREYTEEHVRALSVVAAKLAAYSTTLRARAELAELARERDEARRAAEAASRTKDEFLALVSHELKTPLGSIRAWAHVLASTTADAAARARAVGELERNVDAQARLIDGLLDLACVASADVRLDLRAVEPAALIEATIEGLRLEAERKSIRLESDLEAAAMPLVVDPDRIGQVVSILVANAIDFTPAGGHVQVRLERATGYARIQVSDGGSAISGEALPHVFDHFPLLPQAAEAGTRVPPRLGVGLAIVKDVVELHGGRVRAHSAAAEGGATFTVELPRLSGDGAEPDLPPGGARADGRLLAGVRVLLVDHDLGLREALESVLDDYGAEVTAVASAPEALAALERSRPDALLFGDLAMRGDSVYDLMREVTARAYPLPAVSISAWRVGERERALAAGFRLHLAKPLEIGTLVNAVADVVGRTPRKRKAQALFALPDEERAAKKPAE
jgi:signal transduction histidine kinase/CheY-like chemotaxis protein